MFFRQTPPTHPPTEPVICIHETLGRGPEWLCDDYVEARPVTVGLFINDESFRLLLFFFSSYITFEFFFYINETESKLLSPSHPVDMAFLIQNPRSRVCFSSPSKHAAAGRTALPSTRPTCPRWRPLWRRARWGPPCGRSTPPLSSCQPRSAEMTSCCSSSSAVRRPPEIGREKKECKDDWKNDERMEVCGKRGKGCGGEKGRSVGQSVNKIRQYLFTSSKK